MIIIIALATWLAVQLPLSRCQSSYLSRISRIISVEKNMSRGEISVFYTEIEQFMEFYRSLCLFCSKSTWRKICAEKICVEKKWQIWGLVGLKLGQEINVTVSCLCLWSLSLSPYPLQWRVSTEEPINPPALLMGCPVLRQLARYSSIDLGVSAIMQLLKKYEQYFNIALWESANLPNIKLPYGWDDAFKNSEIYFHILPQSMKKNYSKIDSV